MAQASIFNLDKKLIWLQCVKNDIPQHERRSLLLDNVCLCRDAHFV